MLVRVLVKIAVLVVSLLVLVWLLTGPWGLGEEPRLRTARRRVRRGVLPRLGEPATSS